LCTIGFYALAAVLITVIAAAAAAGAVFVTAATLGAAAVPLTAIQVTTAAEIAAFFGGLGTAGGLTIGFVADYICEWTDICPG
jgi:hypothetical protein